MVDAAAKVEGVEAAELKCQEFDLHGSSCVVQKEFRFRHVLFVGNIKP
jgi:hypothetical protein